MKRGENDNLRSYCVTLLLVYCVGCATLVHHSQKVQSDVPREYQALNESYLSVLNREMRERYGLRRWNQKRHIGFFGFLKRTEKEIGVKVVFPF